MKARADYIRKLNIALTSEWGVVYQLDAFDTFALRVVGDNAEARFAPPNRSTGSYEWRETFACRGGDTTVMDQGEFRSYSAVQFRIAPGGAASTVDIVLNCKGG